MKKRSLFTIVLSLFTLICSAQAPDPGWARSAGGLKNEQNNCMATDSAGNVFTAGFFNSPSLIIGNDTLINADSSGNTNDIFIVKYDSFGNVLWASSAGGTGVDGAYGMSVDRSGNLLISGAFYGDSISFGGITLANSRTTGISSDLFIVKYDPAGNVLWANSAEGVSWETANNVCTDPSGNVIITGYFESPTIIFGNDTLSNAGARLIFVVKYDPMGNVLWANSYAATSNGNSFGIAADSVGNIIVAGHFNASGMFGTFNLINQGYEDVYTMKLNANGTVLWAKSAGGSSSDFPNYTCTDAAGNIFIAGFFRSSSITFGTITLTNVGTASNDIFIVKYDSLGNVMWAKSEGGMDNDYGYGISTDANGNAYLIGYFNSSILNFGSYTLNNNGGVDVFCAKYDAAGNIRWAIGAGGTGSDFGGAVSTDQQGNIFVAGDFTSPDITFGATTLTNTTTGTSDLFLFKINSDCLTYFTTSYDSVQNTFYLTLDPATTSLATAYHWDFGDGTSSSLANPYHVYANDTLYNLCLKIYTAAGDSCEYCHTIGFDSTGNVVRSNGFILNVQNITTDIPSIESTESFTIYPNPSSGKYTISGNDLNISMVNVYNILGECVYQLAANNPKYEIDLSSLDNGIYIVRIENKNRGIINKKIIKQ